jgi:hypothetical protein
MPDNTATPTPPVAPQPSAISLLLAFVEWLGPVVGSIRGSINEAELVRVVVLAFSTAGASGVVSAVIAALPSIVTDPELSSLLTKFLPLATLIVTTIADYVRRRWLHGEPPAPVHEDDEPVPTPAPIKRRRRLWPF